MKTKYSGRLDPHLIYRIKVNQSVDYAQFEKSLNSLGGLTVLSVAEDKKGYWVVFSNDSEFQTLNDKLAQYSGVVPNGHKYDFFNAIDAIEDVPREEKIGELLQKHPLTVGDSSYLNVELWRIDDDQLYSFIDQLKSQYRGNNQFRISDQLVTRSFVLLRVKVNAEIFEELLALKEVARIDRPFIPTFSPTSFNSIDISEFEIAPPADEATGVLVIDSGIVSNHPLLEHAVGGEENFQEGESESQDLVGHGSRVAGNAIYGEIEDCIERREFFPSNWLFSAKVMYGVENLHGGFDSTYDEERLLERQLMDAITSFLDNEAYRIKVVNLSFGNKEEVFKSHSSRQFPLAALIDELAVYYPHVVFVVSTGNLDPREIYGQELSDILEEFPNYLVENDAFRIINPASSALSISVGSIAPSHRYMNVGMDRTEEELWSPVAQENAPSPFTRSGFGMNGMMKPELVHYGGNLVLREQYGRIVENVGGKMIHLSNDPTERLFAFDYGTSFSAPKVTHILGQIANRYPTASANLMKNLLLQSAQAIKTDGFNGNETQQLKSIWQTQGYGVPDINRAIHSFENRVLLFHEGDIGLKQVQAFSVGLPSSFFETKGYKKISVALTFNPPTRATRGDSYLGNRLEFKLFHSVEPGLVVDKFATVDLTDGNDERTPPELKNNEIELIPGTNIRKSGCHQKGSKEYKRETKNMPRTPITLVVMNLNKWIRDENYRQSYCVSVMLEHAEEVNLYESIRTEVMQRVRIR
ncbi:S8 family peptidase [Alicyclobacillus sp. SO9]|uniref:S8 family peptidase n=1 Tax=Alicyclobacillus sp. SO9 TaxID=2665646 RepID=UPI0019391164|nr:S8 family peptidase [Alicyclobacillus sp. SO9]QQE78393.1 S8 family peptidase [Alicyclobacillus sp. SO9]